ncbi:unnamed protein product [Kuraishia capsulata CBS 1993]|uniref:BSD domain-containing protein n=1 Tax=Kuraishia capsulata CBS 1993 TaxID=1382522 RepID=W6MT38_9ASCO|nr:uncharacterized protein KUCA_T00005898001 [Kuraishia capsulata CBS 1993]CDK29904.1 unnamed protein product [Kuraishia capsulata CBS 1993]
MSAIKGAAAYKKKAGMLSLNEEVIPPVLVWRCIDDTVAIPLVEVQLDKITNLKATPATSEKMMLKIITNDPAATVPATPSSEVVFSFNSRATMEEIQRALQQVIARRKASLLAAESARELSLSGTPVPQADTKRSQSLGPQSGSDEETLATLTDPQKLLRNHQLQQKLLMSNKKLMATFKEVVMNSGLDPEEFWSTRINLLRSFAVQNNQKRGSYNVLSTIKPVASSDNEVNVSVTREKIHEIFNQYPIVRKAYDDCVPKISEGDFWSRFFSSKLFRKLRGEKINPYDRGDVMLDKYLYADADYDGEEEEVETSPSSKTHPTTSPSGSPVQKKHKSKNIDDIHINKIIDVMGNEEDNSQKLGNAPDITMRAGKNQDMLSIMKTMNRLSRRMLKSTGVDIEEEDPEKEEQENEEELELNDLRETHETEYNEINFKVNSNKHSDLIKNIPKDSSPLNPQEWYAEFLSELKGYFKVGIDLQEVYNSDEKKKGIREASHEIERLVRQNARQSSHGWHAIKFSASDASSLSSIQDQSVHNEDAEVDPSFLGLDPATIEQLRLTHSTSVEFLCHFWLGFNESATADKAKLVQLRKLYLSIKKCQDRVGATINNIEERFKNVKNEDGELVVAKARELMDPLSVSLDRAIQKYQLAMMPTSGNNA